MDEHLKSKIESSFAVYYSHIPEDIKDSIRRYLYDGIQPGHFLKAVITNNLFEAFNRADYRSLDFLKTIISFFYNVAPGDSWGSIEKYNNYLREVKLEKENGNPNDRQPEWRDLQADSENHD